MSNTIRIKRRSSVGSVGSPTTLKNAELAFNEADNILYYGYGDDGSGDATTIPAIGGPGAFLTLSSEQTVTGNKTFSGTVSLGSSAVATTQSAGNNSTKLATTAYVDGAVSSAEYTFTLAGDGGTTQIVNDEETLTISGGTAITTSSGNTNTLTIDLDDTAVEAGSYGSSTAIATFTVDEQGRITEASETSVATTLSIIDDSANTDQVDLLVDTLKFSEGEGINVVVSDNVVTFSGEDATSSNKGIASFSINDFAVSSGGVSIANVNLGTQTTGNYVASISGTTNQVNVTGSGSENAAVTLSLPQNIHTGASPGFTNLTLSGDAAINGGDITTTSATGNIFTSNATTVNLGTSSAAAVNIGAAISTTTINDDLVVSGNLTVNGELTTINSTTITVDDKNIELASVDSPTDTTANGAGITVLGSTSKTFNWVSATSSWTSSENMDLASGKGYYIGSSSVLTSTAIGSTVVSSSLTSVGTISTGEWNGTKLAIAYGGTNATTAADARDNLGLTIGEDVQQHSDRLADIAGLTASDSYIIVGNGSTWVAETGSTARTSLGLGTISTQNSNNVTITGGSISSVSLDLVTIDGGTF